MSGIVWAGAGFLAVIAAWKLLRRVDREWQDDYR